MIATTRLVTIDWARCQPRRGDVNQEQLARYAEDLRRLTDRGDEALVILSDGDAPAWLGHDFWLQIDSPEVFREWAAHVLSALDGVIDALVPISRPNAFAVDRYVRGRGRRVRMATGFAIRCLDNLVAAHALTHQLAAERGPSLRLVQDSFLEYELDRLVVDLLLHRWRGVEHRQLHEDLAERRAAWYAALPPPSPRQRLVRHFTKSGIPLEQAFPRARAAISECAGRPVDVIEIAGFDRLAPGDRAAYRAAVSTADVPHRCESP